MTDLASKHDETDTTVLDAPDAPRADTPGDGDSTYEWLPAEPEPKKRHLGWWIGGASATVLAGIVVASLVLIAPGTAVAGVNVGLLTQGGAQDALNSRLSETTLALQTSAGEASVTGADLNAQVDATALAEDAFADHPMWNLGAWFSEPTTAAVEIDPVAAEAALRAAVADMYVDPVDATIVFDETSASYTVTAGVDGTGVDLTAVQTALQQAFDEGQATLEVPVEASAVEPATTTAEAESGAATLNAMLDEAGFYIGEDRVVPVDRATAASWLSVGTDETGALSVSADAGSIQSVVDTLPDAVARDVVNATVITNSAGETLRTEVAGVDGRALESTDGIADAYAQQLAGGDAAYELDVTTTPFQTTSLFRRADVNLSNQTVTLYQNDEVVSTMAISSGKAGTETPTGNFTVFAHVAMQDMIGTDYVTEDVPWVTYFAPDIAFHGAYWHNNFGTPMSHGCVNMPVDQAKYVYDWMPNGTEVSVHY